ncbi:uncharacterized protein [Montipora foliosa]|uniref:uncharacterized protein isoform X1 n=2 Tax=Montipora foliosa TaxID=591990 RepID=UPI0035F172E0
MLEMRETMHKSESPKFKAIPYKDWTTTAREARARRHPINLPENLRNYFEDAVKKLPISNILSGELLRGHEQSKSRDKWMDRKAVLSYVSRNRPHPTIYFPFQTGDRLKTYMVWIPKDKHTRSRSLPLVPQGRNSSTLSQTNCQTNRRRSFTYGQSTGLQVDETTYQNEIKRTPFLPRNVKMIDHFPSIGNKNS